MNTSFHKQIYVFPGDCCPSKPPFPPKDQFEQSYAIDTAQSTNIVDSFGNPRYIVSLSSQISSIDLSSSIRVYKTIVTQILSNDLCVFLQIPSDGYESNPYKAHEDFKTCVERYSSLIQSEMKDFNDIDIYAKTIGYEILTPSCCMNCKFGVKKQIAGPHNHLEEKIECHNPDNQQKFTYAEAFPKLPNKDIHKYGYPNSSWQKLPWQQCIPDYGQLPPHDWFMNRIFPTVDPMGTCPKFERPDLSSQI